MAYNNEELYIYDRDLNFLGVIDTYSSLRWRRKYFESGEFEIHLQITEMNLSILTKDAIVIRKESKEAGFIRNIESIEEKEKTKMVITGRFLSYLLYRRIIKSKINYTGSILGGMRKLLNQMRPFNILDIENTNIDSERIVFQCTYRNVYIYIKKLALASNVGFRIVPDLQKKRLIFQNFVGIDRTEEQKNNAFYSFSEEYSNIAKANYLYDSSSLCNYVLIGGEGEGEQRFLTIIDNTKGLHDFDIVETFVDAKGEAREDRSDEEYKELLIERGKENIQDIIESINFDVYIDDYKKNWDLGDVVTVKKESWGIKANLRITEVEEVIEDNSITITPTFGDALPEVFNDEDNM